MDKKHKSIVLICGFWFFLSCLLWAEAMPLLAETGQPGIPERRAPFGDFFRAKFECVRWVQSKAPDKKCLECHSAILKEDDLVAAERNGPPLAVVNVHAQHMRSETVNLTCTTCHKGIDPYEASSAGLRKQVPARMCFKCHFPHGQE